jgi:serine phosphatase RsbU (regulator of sigma subunit)/uncharacterized protein YigA (DUF484 family)
MNVLTAFVVAACGLAVGAGATLAALRGTRASFVRPAAEPRSAQARAERLHRLAAALSRAGNAHDVGVAFLDQALEQLGAQGGSLALRTEDASGLELIAGRDMPGAASRLLSIVPVHEAFAIAMAYRERRPAFAATFAELEQRFPTSAHTFGPRAQAIYALPLDVGGDTVGAFNLHFDHEHEVGAADAEFLGTMARLCGQALERALLAEAESRARERAEESARYAGSLYSLGMRLASALTPADVASTVMREAIEQHGAVAAAVGIIDRARREVELLVDDGYPEQALDVLRRFSLDAPIPAAAAARTSSPVLVGTLEERSERFPLLPPALGDGSVAIACLPLRVADRTYGVLILRYTNERAFGDDERRFLLTLADDCSQALERARLYEREHHIAHALQQGLLPAALPTGPGLDCAVAFAPMGEGNEVGGDFYDLFRTDEGYMVLVGDVCGKGPEAAKLTALCRYTLRTAGMLGFGPSRTLALLNRAFLDQVPEASLFCTVAVASVVPSDSGAGVRATISAGGHAPPLVARHDGTVESPAVRGGALGIVEDPPLREIAIDLAPGDMLIFVTDGIEEARDAAGGFYGRERLIASVRRVLATGAAASASAVVAAVRSDVDAFRGDVSLPDDIVILTAGFGDPATTEP